METGFHHGIKKIKVIVSFHLTIQTITFFIFYTMAERQHCDKKSELRKIPNSEEKKFELQDIN